MKYGKLRIFLLILLTIPIYAIFFYSPVNSHQISVKNSGIIFKDLNTFAYAYGNTVLGAESTTALAVNIGTFTNLNRLPHDFPYKNRRNLSPFGPEMIPVKSLNLANHAKHNNSEWLRRKIVIPEYNRLLNEYPL